MSESVEVGASSGATGPSRRAWVLYAGGAFVVALVLIIGAGLLLRGGDETGGTNGPAARPTYEPTPAPTWNATPLAGVTLPPLRGAQYPGEPTSYIMEDRIWDYVGPGWGLEIFGYNLQGVARDPNAFQGVYLISPEGYPFFLHKLRTDFYLEVLHWDPTERKAWINRCSGDGPGCQTVEFDMVPGDAVEAWVVDGGTAVTADDVIYRATLPGGTIVWEDLGNDYTDAIMTRAPGGPTVVVSALGPATGDSYGGLAGQFWLDMDRGIAYLRTDTAVTEGDSFHFDSAWSTVDLSTGVATPLATVAKEPSDYIAFQSGFDERRAMNDGRCHSRSVVIDGWLLVNCSSTAVTSPDLPGDYLIDPTGVADPIQYSGATPEWTRWTEPESATDFGLPADSGWGAIVRALPLP